MRGKKPNKYIKSAKFHGINVNKTHFSTIYLYLFMHQFIRIIYARDAIVCTVICTQEKSIDWFNGETEYSRP